MCTRIDDTQLFYINSELCISKVTSLHSIYSLFALIWRQITLLLLPHKPSVSLIILLINLNSLLHKPKLRFYISLTHKMWQCLCTITDYKVKDTITINADSAFTNELNKFSPCSKVSQAASANYSLTTENSDVISKERMISIAEHYVRVVLRRVNTRNEVGPDGTTNHLLYCCDDQRRAVHFYQQVLRKVCGPHVLHKIHHRSRD